MVVGTRPEAVKLGPVLRAGASALDLRLSVLATGQHGALLRSLGAAYAVDAPAVGAQLGTLQERVESSLRRRRPAAVLAQGDTASVLAAARAAFGCGVPFVHLEAGLRTGDVGHPFPEEPTRVEVARLATLHLAPTAGAAANLRAEGIDPARIVITGNTVVDAVRHTRASLPSDGRPPPDAPIATPKPGRRRIVLTHHRRESLPHGAEAVARAVCRVAHARPEVEVMLPMHPNPAVARALAPLRAVSSVTVLPPLSHAAFVWLLAGSVFAISDSGGLQEEAPSLGVPVLVTRVRTERPEAVAQGSAIMVGWDEAAIEAAALRWLDDPEALARARPSDNPFGDGLAGPRCVAALRNLLGLTHESPRAWRAPRASSVEVRQPALR